MAENEFDTREVNNCSQNGGFNETVCIDAQRVYDSCGDKDCLEDLEVYFTPPTQNIIDKATNVRLRDVEVITVLLDLEPVPFHKGFYSVDMTFFFEVTLDVFQTPAAPPVTISGLSVFSKNVVLYGSEGNVKVFSSDGSLDELEQNSVQSLPKASVQVAQPVGLSARLCEAAASLAAEFPTAFADGTAEASVWKIPIRSFTPPSVSSPSYRSKGTSK